MKRGRWVIGAAGVGLLALLGWRISQTLKPARTAPPAAAVTVSLRPVERQDVELSLEGLGTIVPQETVLVRSRVDGQLVEVLFREGQEVRKGDPLAQIDSRPYRIAVAQARGTYARDLAKLKVDRLNLERLKGLVEEKLIAPQQVDNQRSLVEQDRGVLAIDAAQLDNAKLQLEWSRIVSPVDGIAGIRQVDPGNQIHATDVSGLVTITRLDPITVIFTLPQDALPQIALAQARGAPLVEVFARTGGVKLGEGTLSAIDNQVSVSTATLRLRAQLPNPDHRLWPNAFVTARIFVETRKDALVVPTVAVQRGPNGAFVYVAARDGTAQLRPVTTDASQRGVTLIRSGVVEGEQVVVDGQNQLRPGAKLEPRPVDGGTPDAGIGPTAAWSPAR